MASHATNGICSPYCCFFDMGKNPRPAALWWFLTWPPDDLADADFAFGASKRRFGYSSLASDRIWPKVFGPWFTWTLLGTHCEKMGTCVNRWEERDVIGQGARSLMFRGSATPFWRTSADRLKPGIILRTGHHVILREAWLLKRHESVSKIENELLERILCFWRKLHEISSFWGEFQAAKVYSRQPKSRERTFGFPANAYVSADASNTMRFFIFKAHDAPSSSSSSPRLSAGRWRPEAWSVSWTAVRPCASAAPPADQSIDSSATANRKKGGLLGVRRHNR